MLGWVKGLFGRSNNDGSERAAHSRPRSATGTVLAQGRRPDAAAGSGSQERVPAQGDAGSAEFDPYNTGKFDRAASWERVRHSHR